MKAVLISIRPKWCEKIMTGQKTIEVRKTRPKMDTPFKCYIYKCGNGKLDLLDEYGRVILTSAKINRLERVCFPAELHVGDRAWKKAMSILDKKYAEAKKIPFVRDPLAWALYHTWREFDDGKRCD